MVVVAAAGGFVWLDPPLLIGGFGLFVMSDMSESAFGPAFTSTPANEAGCAYELE